MTLSSNTFPSVPSLSPHELVAWRNTPEYRAAQDFGIDMNLVEFLQTLSPTERIERNDCFAALVAAARVSHLVPSP